MIDLTPEQNELDHKFQGALIMFNEWLNYMRKNEVKGNDGYSAADLFENAIENVMNVHNDWRKHLGEPVKLSPSALANELRKLADKIERE